MKKLAAVFLAALLFLCACGRTADEPQSIVTPRPRQVGAPLLEEIPEGDESAAALPAYAEWLRAGGAAELTALCDFTGDRTPELAVIRGGELILLAWADGAVTQLDRETLPEGARLYQAAGGRDLLLTADGGGTSLCVRFGGARSFRRAELASDGEHFSLDGRSVEKEAFYQALAEFPTAAERELADLAWDWGAAAAPG